MSTTRLFDIQPKEATYAHNQTITNEASALSYYANAYSFLLIIETNKKISAIHCSCSGNDTKSYASYLVTPKILNAAEIKEDIKSKKHLVSIGIDSEEITQLKKSYQTLDNRVDFICLGRETLLTELLSDLPGIMNFVMDAEINRQQQKSGCSIL